MEIALIENATGTVVTVVDVPSIADFDPGPGLTAVEATDEVAYAGCTWTDGGFVEPPVQPPSTEELVAYAADKRWRVETGGIMVAGVPVATDDRSKIMIIGARVKADADANFTTQWKAETGEFVTIDAATIIAISDAVLAHVDACFAAEAVVLAGIEAGTVTTTGEIDAGGP